MTNKANMICDIIGRGFFYKRDYDYSNVFTGDILKSLDDLEYTDPAKDAENAKSDFRMIRRDMDESIRKCKNEFRIIGV